MISDKFVIVGALVQLWGILVYAKETWRGKTKPNRVTWFLWSLAPLIAFAAELSKGVGLKSLMTLSVGLGPLIILVVSFANKKSYWQLKPSDYLCGLLSIVGLILWLTLNEGNLAIIFSVLADGFAALPTLVKSFYHPETESEEAYTVAIVNAGITLLAIKTWTLANFAFPIYIFIVNIIFVLFIRYKLGKTLLVRTS